MSDTTVTLTLTEDDAAALGLAVGIAAGTCMRMLRSLPAGSERYDRWTAMHMAVEAAARVVNTLSLEDDEASEDSEDDNE